MTPTKILRTLLVLHLGYMAWYRLSRFSIRSWIWYHFPLVGYQILLASIWYRIPEKDFYPFTRCMARLITLITSMVIPDSSLLVASETSCLLLETIQGE